jgi:hypothetical protein
MAGTACLILSAMAVDRPGSIPAVILELVPRICVSIWFRDFLRFFCFSARDEVMASTIDPRDKLEEDARSNSRASSAPAWEKALSASNGHAPVSVA